MQTSEKLTYPCSRCNKVLKTRHLARRHGILVHNWDTETDCVPTDEIITQFKRRKIALTDPLAASCARTLSEEADSESCSIDTTISKKSTVKHPDMEPDSDSDGETEDEPHITHVDPPPIPPTDPEIRIATKPMKIPTIPQKPVTKDTKLCQRAKNDQVQSVHAVKQSSVLQTLRETFSTGRTDTASSSTPAKKVKLPLNVDWPKRYLSPPIADIIQYRKDMEAGTTPDEVGQAAASYHEWTDQPVFSAANNVSTVLKAYDFGQRELLTDFKKYIQDEPTSFDDAVKRWKAFHNWINYKMPPETLQRFSD